MIAIIDYGAGNLASVKKALDFVGAESAITQDGEMVREAEKIVLPGVGHFAATAAIASLGLRDPIRKAIDAGVPFLGICVGMQWMFAGSTEAQGVPGLGLLPGICERFPAQVKCPHVGWNRIVLSPTGLQSKLLRGVMGSGTASPADVVQHVYFTHSYRVPATPADNFSATADYAGCFAAVVEKGNAFGVQFHVEKSADIGLKILRNFVDL